MWDFEATFCYVWQGIQEFCIFSLTCGRSAWVARYRIHHTRQTCSYVHSWIFIYHVYSQFVHISRGVIFFLLLLLHLVVDICLLIFEDVQKWRRLNFEVMCLWFFKSRRVNFRCDLPKKKIGLYELLWYAFYWVARLHCKHIYSQLFFVNLSSRHTHYILPVINSIYL